MMRKLELPKTMLRLHGGDLTKYVHPETIVGRFPLEQIADIRLERHTEYFGVIFAAIGAALAAVAKVYVPWEGWGWAAAVVCLALALLCALIVSGRKIVIETREGPVGYVVADAIEEAEGFVITLRQVLRTGGKGDNADEPSPASQ
ncbi:MAG: hypothetical protein KY475_20880 [Planctomycetes bacterium]|nr:hypothetical protein [Planctomycetota bacterium]